MTSPAEATNQSTDPGSKEVTSPAEATNQSTDPGSNMRISNTPTDTISEAKFFQRSESLIFGEDDPSIQRSNEQFFGEEFTQTDLMFPPHPTHPPWGPPGGNLPRPLHEVYPLRNHPHSLKPFTRKEQPLGSSTGGEAGKLPVSYAHQCSRYDSKL